MREIILTPRAQGNLQHHHQNWKTWNSRTINTWSRFFSVCEGFLGMSALDATYSMEAYKTNALLWECLWLRRWKPPFILGRIISRIRKSHKNTKIRGYWECVQHYAKVGERTFWRSSECEMLGVFITFLGGIGTSQWSSDQMGESRSMCLRWFRSLCWTDERHSKSSRKMERTSGRTQFVFVVPRCSGYRWRSNWIRVDNFPGFSSLSILEEIQPDLEKRHIQPEESTDRIIFMSMFNDNVWNTNGETCVSNAEKVKNYAMRFPEGHWTFLGPGSEEKWYGSSYHVQEGQWNCTAAKMVQRLKETGHLVFKSISAFESWDLEAKER